MHMYITLKNYYKINNYFFIICILHTCILFSRYMVSLPTELPYEQACTVTFSVTMFASLNRYFPVDHSEAALKQSV